VDKKLALEAETAISNLDVMGTKLLQRCICKKKNPSRTSAKKTT
jgi:hypothetical protein